MRKLFILSLTLAFMPAFSSLAAQDCGPFIEKELNVGGLHMLRTIPLTIVIRGTYTYSIQLTNDEKGLRAKVISRGGVEFNQDDEIIFMDVNTVRKGYRFVGAGETKDDNGTPEYINYLQINLAAVQWFSEADINTIYIKNNISKEMRKFTVNPNRMTDFRIMADCFNRRLNKSAVVDVATAERDYTKPGAGDTGLLTSKPDAGAAKPPAGSAEKPATQGAAGTDQELDALRGDLAQTKEQIRR